MLNIIQFNPFMFNKFMIRQANRDFSKIVAGFLGVVIIASVKHQIDSDGCENYEVNANDVLHSDIIRVF